MCSTLCRLVAQSVVFLFMATSYIREHSNSFVKGVISVFLVVILAFKGEIVLFLLYLVF